MSRPYVAKFSECRAVDDDGQRCDKRAVEEVDYFGDPSVHPRVKWVRVWLCEKHGGTTPKEGK